MTYATAATALGLLVGHPSLDTFHQHAASNQVIRQMTSCKGGFTTC